jgi:hypothetical protein
MLERLVDTPVRGFVLDEPPDQPQAKELVAAAGATWRIPTRVVDAGHLDAGEWVEAMRAAVSGLIAGSG